MTGRKSATANVVIFFRIVLIQEENPNAQHGDEVNKKYGQIDPMNAHSRLSL
jgi:hypothetical protein